MSQLEKKLRNLISDYNYKIYLLGKDLPNLSELDYTKRCSLEKTVIDLEELLK